MHVGFIGTGSMGQMLVKAFTAAGALRPADVVASNRSPHKLSQLAATVPGLRAAGNVELVQECPVVFVCVKPLETGALLDEIGPSVTNEHLIITLTNAIPLADFERALPARVAKLIPSITQEALGGVALVMYGCRINAADREYLEGLIAAIAHPRVIDEERARVCADLTSVAPAFLCYLLRGMATAAAQRQPLLSRSDADTLVRLMAEGVGRLLGSGEYDCAEVVRRVAVPGGLTAEALKVMEHSIGDLWEQVLATTSMCEEERRLSLSAAAPGNRGRTPLLPPELPGGGRPPGQQAGGAHTR